MPSLGTQINHRVDGGQSDQTGEAKILVIHAGIAQAPQAARLAPVALKTVEMADDSREYC